MKFRRTLAPAAAPVGVLDVVLSALEVFTARRSQARLERELQEYLGLAHVAFVSSGKAALTLTLQALHTLRPARRVVLPAYTCFSVPAAVIRAGLEPVLVDVDPATFDFDVPSLKRALDQSDVLCVIPVHLFGVASNVEQVRALASPRDVFVVEDAAQALGLTASDGRRLGSRGDVSVYSLGRGKHLTCGGGGIIATNSPAIAARCREVCARLPPAGLSEALRAWLSLAVMSVFIDPRLYWLPAGLPFLGLGETAYEPDFEPTRLPVSGPGALRRWKTRLERANQQRQSVSEAWVAELGVDTSLTCRRPLLRFPFLAASSEERAALVERARRRGLGASTLYPSAIHRIPELQELFAGQRFSGADILASRLVTLPTHGYVRPSDRAAVRRILAESRNAVSAADTHTAAASC